MMIIGTDKQERKIEIMARAASEMFPQIEELVFKGCFRYGIEYALKQNKYESWKNVEEKSLADKVEFFNTGFKGSIDKLSAVGLKDREIEYLFEKLWEKNRDFLLK